MDQNTVITLAVVGGVALVLFVGMLLFAWRQSSQLARRRFNPSQPIVQPWAMPQASPQGNQSRGCECPPKSGPKCVPARVGDVEDVPHAIYGLASGECCGGSGKLTRAEVQTLVNELNLVHAAEERKRLFDRLASVVAQG